MTQLVDASTTSLLWANRFDGNSRSSFDLQDQITAQLVGAVASRLEQAEYDRVNHRDPGEPDAYSLTLRGLNSLHRWTRDGIDEALRLFRTATEIDPANAPAH